MSEKKTERRIKSVTKNSLIMEVVSDYPEAVEILQSHGMGCFGCAMARMETIEQGALAHGLDVKKLMADINKVVKSKK